MSDITIGSKAGGDAQAADDWPFTETLSDEKRAYQERIFAEHPLMRMLNYAIDDFSYGSAAFTMPWQEQLSNYGFELHGGMHATMIDSVTGQAIFTALKRGFRLTTVHMDIRYFRPFTEGIMRAEANVVKWGKALCHAEAKITANEQVIATGMTIYAIIDSHRRTR